MKSIFSIFALLFTLHVAAQQQEISGTVRDKEKNEPIPGANVVVDGGKSGTATKPDGTYTLKLDPGPHTLLISSASFQPQKVNIKVGDKPVTMNFSLESMVLDEVEIAADMAINRKTPVAFSNITAAQIQEEISGRDVSMMANSTPGAYATEQGGGSGDSRVNIRGFDQRNVAVMVDGVPVNDMENGQVYWSNWDGLSDVTRTMQIQRGLGASRLAIPSVGGTMNVITKGIDEKRSISIKQEVGNDLMFKTSAGFNSGEMKHGWGVTLAGARRTGEGWADQTFTDSWSYFGKVQKRFGNHLISASGSGAPQKHGQRYDKMSVAIYDEKLAHDLGVNVDSIYQNGGGGGYTTLTQRDRGLRYNPDWGYLSRDGGATQEKLNMEMNYFHKPQFNLSDYWNINEHVYLTNVAYASFGNGGGNFLRNTGGVRDTLTGLINYQRIWDGNSAAMDALYSTTEHKSSNIIQSSINQHRWYGLLSTLTWTPRSHWSFVYGLDARYYKGSHFRTVYDLLGGDYFIDNSDRNQPNGIGNLQYAMKREGDKITYYNDSYVYWGGVFGQAEFKKNDWSSFATVTYSETGYQRMDHFLRRDVILDDGTVVPTIVGYNETYYTNGTQSGVAKNGAVITNVGDTTFINNPSGTDYKIANAKGYSWNDARMATTERKWFSGYTAKGGANYNIDEHQNVFVNVGYMNMAPRFNNVFDNSNKVFLGIENQKVYAVEAGYGQRYRKFAANLNVYYTYWHNKPPDFTPTVNIGGDVFSYNINGMNAVHKGVELDFHYSPITKLQVDGVVSIGDWRYDAAQRAYIYDQDEHLVDSVDFSARGVHVGNAAQTQLGISVRYEIIKRLYVKARVTRFDRHWANFDPLALAVDYDTQGNIISDNRDRQSWVLPGYTLLDLFAGYDFKYFKIGKNDKNIRFTITASVTNVLNTIYIADGSNGAYFDANSSTVYMGLGRRWTTGLKLSF